MCSIHFQFSSVQFSRSVVSDFATPWIPARQASLSINNSWSSLRLTSIESVMPSSHLILCHTFSSCPHSLPASESFPMSQLFAWGGPSTGVSALSIIPSKEIPGLISFRMDWLDLLAVQGALKSLQKGTKRVPLLLAISSMLYCFYLCGSIIGILHIFF